MKKILFVINTMGRAGAERALLGLLRRLEGRPYAVSLYVLLAQGELAGELPPGVRLLNPEYSAQDVLSGRGRRQLVKTVCKAFFRNGGCIRKARGIAGNLANQLKNGRVQPDKLLWRVAADGALRFEEHFDLAVAWMEGGSAYYTADWVRASRKAAFIHVDYGKAGYTKALDQGCWARFDRIFAVSEDCRSAFLQAYPELRSRTGVFQNIVSQEEIRRRSREPGGFSDGYQGLRLLTVGRLAYQKGYDIAIDAMKLLKDAGYRARWYVLGEGSERRRLEKQIARLGLQEDFVLLGAAENPYPYYVQADLYVHAVRFEGQGIAVWEAQTLGCPVIVSDYCGSSGQIEGGVYGVPCELTPAGVAEAIRSLLDDAEKRETLARRAAGKETPQGQEEQLFALLEDPAPLCEMAGAAAHG